MSNTLRKRSRVPPGPVKRSRPPDASPSKPAEGRRREPRKIGPSRHMAILQGTPPARSGNRTLGPSVLALWHTVGPSAAAHEAGLVELLSRMTLLAKSAQAKLDFAADEVLSPLEKSALMMFKSAPTSRGVSPLGAGTAGPKKLWKALLGRVLPVLGSYAMSLAMQWLNSEIKFIITAFDATTDWTTTVLTQLLNGCAQGLTVATRIGNSIRILGVSVDLTFNATVAAQITSVSSTLLVDTQTEGAAPPSGDVYASGVTVLAHAAVPNTTTAPDRFAIIDHQKFAIALMTTTTGNANPFLPAQHHIKFDRSLVAQDLHVLFQGTDGTVSSISKGSMYLCGLASAATSMTVSGHIRVAFEDN